jgi:hypothetical protein
MCAPVMFVVCSTVYTSYNNRMFCFIFMAFGLIKLILLFFELILGQDTAISWKKNVLFLNLLFIRYLKDSCFYLCPI